MAAVDLNNECDEKKEYKLYQPRITIQVPSNFNT